MQKRFAERKERIMGKEEGNKKKKIVLKRKAKKA